MSMPLIPPASFTNKPHKAATPWVDGAYLTAPQKQLSEVRSRGEWVFWHQKNPGQNGCVMAQSPSGAIRALTPPEHDVGGSLHYGGAGWDVQVVPAVNRTTLQNNDAASAIITVVFADRRQGGLFALHIAAGADKDLPAPTPLLEAAMAAQGRFGGICLAPDAKRLFCVMETPHPHARLADDSSLVEISLEGPGKGRLVQRTKPTHQGGADFHLTPTLSYDGQWLAWVEWDAPNMPWTATRLCAMALCGPGAGEKTILDDGQEGGHRQRHSLIEPRFAPDENTLYVLSDRCGYWTPECHHIQEGLWQQRSLPAAPGEVGMPPWVLGYVSYLPLGRGNVVARVLNEGQPSCWLLEAGKVWRPLEAPGFTPAQAPTLLAGAAGQRQAQWAWLNEGTNQPVTLLRGPLAAPHILATAGELPAGLTADDVATPRWLRVPDGQGSFIGALYWPPATGPHCVKARDHGATPPMVVRVHGGPTAQASGAFSPKVQWWTCRGFAVLDVNYRGSTGFGRAYHQALEGRWGELDVEDCIQAARWCVTQGLAAADGLFIRGSSAGGLTVLAALARSNLFKGGTSLYGVTDMSALAQDTHRFEARYLDGLVAPWPAGRALYQARSPLSWPERIKAPVLFLHGDADQVVPLAQTETMRKALGSGPMHVYPGEGHGFRTPWVVADSMQRESEFYRSLL
ncbi:S9 family peptidase [Formicincola oecophyllae]|uniref:S9 family peptidase n=1 Tax=Formicincola oecophyllae TaxID=2558361 RepID=A0A4Y6U8K5_9PROT|nr:S9 family peptidase [Formicincola oecophyllae]